MPLLRSLACVEEPKPGCFFPPVPAAISCGLSTCKAGSDVGTWLVCKAEHPFLEEQCGNESLGIGHWVIPGANVAHMGEMNI